MDNRNEMWRGVDVIKPRFTALADKVWGMRQGARDYVVKPVDPDELIGKIRAFD